MQVNSVMTIDQFAIIFILYPIDAFCQFFSEPSIQADLAKTILYIFHSRCLLSAIQAEMPVQDLQASLGGDSRLVNLMTGTSTSYSTPTSSSSSSNHQEVATNANANANANTTSDRTYCINLKQHAQYTRRHYLSHRPSERSSHTPLGNHPEYAASLLAEFSAAKAAKDGARMSRALDGLGMVSLVDKEIQLTKEEKEFHWTELLIRQVNFIEAILVNMRDVPGHEEITHSWLVSLKEPLIYCFTLFTYINQTREKSRESSNVVNLLQHIIEQQFSRKTSIHLNT